MPSEQGKVIAVAYSGGCDSTALLHATLAASADSDLTVAALHVHHGLSRHADAWLSHCEAQCRAWSAASSARLVFAAFHLAGRPSRGASVEAWARVGRYRGLRELANATGASAVLLGHHRRDQAETYLLQALRGAGVAGLAGMPKAAVRDGIAWLRPWLERSEQDIRAYARYHRLDWVDDDSNADCRFARNALRHELWPGFAAAFPDAEAAFARSAAWAAEAAAALDELAAIDMANVTRDDQLDLAAWLQLSPVRRSLVLRSWVRTFRCGVGMPATLTRRLLAELPAARSDAVWTLPGGRLRLYRGALRYVAAATPPSIDLAPETALRIDAPGVFSLPGWRGRLTVAPVASAGIALSRLAQIELRPRCGAERLQLAHDRPPRSLKKQYQSAAVPACDRTGPLVFSEGRLVFVPGLGLDARVFGPDDEALVTLAWEPGAGP